MEARASKIGPPFDVAGALAALRQNPALRQPLVRPCGRLTTGFSALDEALGGGLPRGAITEIVSSGPRSARRALPASAGRTSLALAMVGRATRAGEYAAWIDTPDALDPRGAEAAGASLSQLLWVRPQGRDALKQALKATDIVTSAGGFALVVLDLVEAGKTGLAQSPSVWVRLNHRLGGGGTALAVLTAGELVSTAAHLRLACEWRGFLRGRQEVEIRVLKQRGGQPGGAVRLQLENPVD